MAALALGCTEVDPDASCEDGATCTKGRVCDEATHLCRVSPPVVVIQSPTPTDVFDAGTLLLRGAATDNTKVARLEYQVTDGGVWTPLAHDGGSFAQLIALPAVNRSALPITVHAVDDFGAESFATVVPLVDSLAPTVTSNASDLGRRVSTTVTLDFGEPVQVQGGLGGALSPAPLSTVTRADSSSVTYTLAFDTYYVFTLAANAVRDGFGHPMPADVRLRFYTQVRSPTAQTSIPFSFAPADFDAVSDDDGAAVIALQSGDGHYEWGRFDTHDGTYVRINTLSSQGPRFGASAGMVLSSEGAPQRVRGFWERSLDATSGSTDVAVDDGANASGAHFGLIPVVALPGEAASSTPFAYVEAGPDYARTGGSSTSFEYFPDFISSRADGQWLALALYNGSPSSGYTVRHLSPAPSGGNMVIHRANMAVVANVENANLSFASLSNGSALYVFKTYGGGWHEACASCPECAETAGPEVDPPHFVVAGLDGTSVYGARLASGGLSADLLQKQVTPECNTAWTSLGTVAFHTPATKVLALVAGSRVGVLAQHTAGIELVYPP